MEMKRMSGGSLCASGFVVRARKLFVELSSGTLELRGVSCEVWRRLITSWA